MWVNAELRGDTSSAVSATSSYFIFYLCLLAAAHQLVQRQPCAPHARPAGRPARFAAARRAHGRHRRAARRPARARHCPFAAADRRACATLLVIAGQAFATREMTALHREVATRRFDERLTELVRRSSDIIAICDAMASPLCQPFVRSGSSADARRNRRPANRRVLGPKRRTFALFSTRCSRRALGAGHGSRYRGTMARSARTRW